MQFLKVVSWYRVPFPVDFLWNCIVPIWFFPGKFFQQNEPTDPTEYNNSVALPIFRAIRSLFLRPIAVICRVRQNSGRFDVRRLFHLWKKKSLQLFCRVHQTRLAFQYVLKVASKTPKSTNNDLLFAPCISRNTHV